MKIDPRDWSFVPLEPDPGFDEERNKRVIAETLEANERLRLKRQREFGSKIRERSEALSRYLDDLVKGKTSSSVEQYFGKKEIARLRGEEIIDLIKARMGDATIKKAIRKAKKVSPPKLD